MHDLNKTDHTYHSLAQLLALTGTNLLPVQPDDRQANIFWNSEQSRLEGRPFRHGGQQLRFVIDLPTFSLQYLDENDSSIATFLADNQTPAQAIAWWQDIMGSWGVKPVKPLNYQLETDPVALDTPYSRPVNQHEWAYWRTLANRTLADLNRQSGHTSAIRIWPHHFDTGVYYPIADEQGQERAAIWAGYAMADHVCPEPYFYLSGYNSQHPFDFTTASTLSAGQWLMHPDWQGACLPVSQITDSEQITRFLTESYTWIAGNVGGE